MTKSLTLSSGRVLVLHKFFWAITRGMAGYAMSCTPFAFSFLLVNGEDKYIILKHLQYGTSTSNLAVEEHKYRYE